MENQTGIRLKLNRRRDGKTLSVADVAKLTFDATQVAFNRIIEIKNNFLVITRNQTDADKLLRSEMTKKFEERGYDLVAPPELRAKKTIFIRKLDRHIGDRNSDEIKTEIETQNTWAKVAQVIKIKEYTHVIKVVFDEIKMADVAQERGMVAFNMSITPSQMEREEYINLQICFSCYKYESHETKNCKTKEINCSECGVTGHTWTECKAGTKQCLNCKGPHRTLAMACPVKKRAMETKRNMLRTERESAGTRTYAGVASAAPSQVTQIQLSGGMDQKMLACMLHAHLVNMGSPGTYQETLKQLFVANGLTPIVIPNNPNSEKIFGIIPGGKCQPENYKIKEKTTTTTASAPEPESSEMEIQASAEEAQPSVGTRDKLRTRDPRKLKNRHKELVRLCRDVPAFCEGLALRVMSTDKNPKLANVFKPRGRRDRPQTVLQYHDPRDVTPGLQMNLEGAITEADVEFLFLEGLIQDQDYDTITVDGDTLKKARPGLPDYQEN